ncbi:ATP-dependent DNA ligase [Rhodobacter sp. Har01]|uniref:ATP-dependent DNA ligase n=1 Tax=Rhodobacter sp. Har01 TaxID=2883999 RepID=UPI001D07814B|nr:ATP-dependent DNA ligase [Rhodobacter sp. Har01]MCB6178805.1 ATP-dependent DNA ligase [Rhodobacter sp. Har01]
MKAFATLFAVLDATTSTAGKTAALADYFRTAPDADKVWTIALLSGRRPRRAATATELRTWAAEAAGLSPWLFEESHAVVGDLAETIALILPSSADIAGLTGLDAVIRRLIALTGQPAEARRAAILALWASLPPAERFLATKLLTGGFRMGVSQGLMTRALAQATGRAEADLAHALMGDWNPAQTAFGALVSALETGAGSRPYPFALASPLEAAAATLGDPVDWRAEWKWDGIRGQIVARPGAFALWSRGEELITDRFPEFAPLRDHLPEGTVMDGEVLAWDRASGRPLPFAALQRRIGRKTVPKALLREAPAQFLAYDLLEAGGEDLRAQPFAARREALDTLLAGLPPGLPLAASPLVTFYDWDALAVRRQTAREGGTEGLMLKRAASPYLGGRKRGDWWKWKLDPYSIDAVMLYAQAGHGRRAGLFTDFTFAVRDGEALVPVAKAYSGLTDAEFAEITAWVQRHTLERFGPVRRVPPDLVFEIAFEGIQASPRHKSGIALRFPRMLRWRRDKPVAEIDTLEALRGLLAADRGLRAPGPPRDI